MTLKAEKFEELLTSELNGALEPQRGKALAAFRAYAAEEAARPAIAGSVKPGKDISRGETWFWASVPSLVAACLAVVVTLKLLTPAASVPTTTTGGTDSIADDTPGVRVIISPHVEQSEQLMQNNGRLAHVQQYQWTDPNEKSNYKLTSDEQEAPATAPF